MTLPGKLPRQSQFEEHYLFEYRVDAPKQLGIDSPHK